MFNNARIKRKGFLLLTLIAVLLTVLVGILLMHRLQTKSVQSIQYSVERWQTSLTAMRWVVITFMALFWNLLVNGLANSGVINERQTNGLIALRWHAVTWLVLLEMIIGQGLLSKVVSLISGSGQ